MSDIKTARPRIPSPFTVGIVADYTCNSETISFIIKLYLTLDLTHLSYLPYPISSKCGFIIVNTKCQPVEARYIKDHKVAFVVTRFLKNYFFLVSHNQTAEEFL